MGQILINPNLKLDRTLVLTEADPKSALECLKQTVGKCDRETLLQFTWRRNVVWALEKIAVWQDLFADAAQLLLGSVYIFLHVMSIAAK